MKYANRMDRIKASEIRELLKLTQRPEIISFAGGLPAPELFPLEAVEKAMVDAFGRVKEVKLLIEGNAEDKEREVGWLSDAAKEFKGKLQIRQCERVPHWLIIDGKHFRLEKSHPIGAIGRKNLAVYDVDQPYISEILEQKFEDWWNIANLSNS